MSSTHGEAAKTAVAKNCWAHRLSSALSPTEGGGGEEAGGNGQWVRSLARLLLFPGCEAKGSEGKGRERS